MGRNIFAPDEIVRLAIEVEENGMMFYKSIVDKVQGEELKQMMDFLADEERRHKRIFEDLLNGIGEREVVEVYPGEYQAYMKALAEECVFTKELIRGKMEEGFEDMFDLLDFALRIEKDSIMLYIQMKDNLLKDHPVLDKVIEEERKHYVLISELKQQYRGVRE